MIPETAHLFLNSWPRIVYPMLQTDQRCPWKVMKPDRLYKDLEHDTSEGLVVLLAVSIRLYTVTTWSFHYEVNFKTSSSKMFWQCCWEIKWVKNVIVDKQCTYMFVWCECCDYLGRYTFGFTLTIRCTRILCALIAHKIADMGNINFYAIPNVSNSKNAFPVFHIRILS